MMRNAIATGERLLNLNSLDLGNLPAWVKFCANSIMLHRSNLFLSIMLALALAAASVKANDQDIKLAQKFRERAANGDLVAINNLGALYLKGRGVEQDYTQARVWFEQAAEAKLPAAMFNLAMIYLRGYGVEISIERANELLNESAHYGDRDAQFFLGLHYYHGTGLPRNLDAAKSWFRRAAEQNVAAAMYNLGILYLDPDPTVGDENLAMTWLEKAASAGYPGVELIIAQVNLSHHEDPERVALGAQQYIKLAESNNIDAQIQLGMMFTLGEGVTQNFDEGRFWLERAATQGAAQAQLNLGNIYADGVGVIQNRGKALAWYTIAAENGDAVAAGNVESLTAELSDSERATAQRETAELRARYGSDLDTIAR